MSILLDLVGRERAGPVEPGHDGMTRRSCCRSSRRAPAGRAWRDPAAQSVLRLGLLPEVVEDEILVNPRELAGRSRECGSGTSRVDDDCGALPTWPARPPPRREGRRAVVARRGDRRQDVVDRLRDHGIRSSGSSSRPSRRARGRPPEAGIASSSDSRRLRTSARSTSTVPRPQGIRLWRRPSRGAPRLSLRPWPGRERSGGARRPPARARRRRSIVFAGERGRGTIGGAADLV